MKFSIIIPTQNRPELIVLAVHYVLSQKYENFELIVSDNSMTADFKEHNRIKLKEYIHANKLLLVSPSTELSAPEHFEFALQYVTGDYILFLTDKMILLPGTLSIVAEAIKKSSAEIVNWTFSPFIVDDYLKPFNSGRLEYSLKPLTMGYKEYDPSVELNYKASGFFSRPSMNFESYVKGKICFGCFSKDLILRIISKSGALFGGATHDYSAMVQALCLATKCIVLNEPRIIFITLPVDRSWGSLANFQAPYARRYYQAFSDPELILRSLLVPGLYSSIHNMVAHDYIKYLALYGKQELFIEKFWLRSIGNDLYLPNKLWGSEEERYAQYNLFFEYLNKNLDAKIYYYYNVMLQHKAAFLSNAKLFMKNVILSNLLGQRILEMRRRTLNFFPKELEYAVVQCHSLDAAIKLISAGCSAGYAKWQ